MHGVKRSRVGRTMLPLLFHHDPGHDLGLSRSPERLRQVGRSASRANS